MSLHEAFAVLTADELTEIADKAASQAKLLRTGEASSFTRGWAVIFDYIAASARFALAQRELDLSNV